jgi:hypothetical protein
VGQLPVFHPTGPQGINHPSTLCSDGLQQHVAVLGNEIDTRFDSNECI